MDSGNLKIQGAEINKSSLEKYFSIFSIKTLFPSRDIIVVADKKKKKSKNEAKEGIMWTMSDDFIIEVMG